MAPGCPKPTVEANRWIAALQRLRVLASVSFLDVEFCRLTCQSAVVRGSQQQAQSGHSWVRRSSISEAALVSGGLSPVTTPTPERRLGGSDVPCTCPVRENGTLCSPPKLGRPTGGRCRQRLRMNDRLLMRFSVETLYQSVSLVGFIRSVEDRVIHSMSATESATLC